MRSSPCALLLLTASIAAGSLLGCTGGGAKDSIEPVATVTPVAEALSPFAAEVRWTTSSTSASPVAFRESTGGAEVLVVKNDDAGDGVTEHRVLLQGLAPQTSYDIRVGDGTAFTGTTTVQTGAAPSGPFRVLFDAAHGETAGNADWVIDDDEPTVSAPSPADPSSETAWSGAYSSWGYALHETGRYQVQSLPVGGTFTFGGGGALDLSNFDVVILPEPNNTIPLAGLQALRDFCAAGGGLFLIADHEGSDRDNDGVESYEVLNALADTDPAWGWRMEAQSFNPGATDDVVDDAREPLLHGQFGEVAQVGFYAATALRILPAMNPRMRQILWRPGQTGGTAGLFIAAGYYGSGRVVIIGDSSPADDGTANPGNSNIFDSWHDPAEDNAAFHLNATAWLANDL